MKTASNITRGTKQLNQIHDGLAAKFINHSPKNSSKLFKEHNHSNKNNHQYKNSYGPFLHSTNQQESTVVIKNPQVLKLCNEIDGYGPYYSHCPSHKIRNIEFFGNMKPVDSIRLLTHIKSYRINTKLNI